MNEGNFLTSEVLQYMKSHGDGRVIYQCSGWISHDEEDNYTDATYVPCAALKRARDAQLVICDHSAYLLPIERIPLDVVRDITVHMLCSAPFPTCEISVENEDGSRESRYFITNGVASLRQCVQALRSMALTSRVTFHVNRWEDISKGGDPSSPSQMEKSVHVEGDDRENSMRGAPMTSKLRAYRRRKKVARSFMEEAASAIHSKSIVKACNGRFGEAADALVAELQGLVNEVDDALQK